MPRRKDYAFGRNITDSIQTNSSPEANDLPRSSAIDFYHELGPEARTVGGRRIDLADMLGHGVDEWVYACISCMRKMLRGKVVQPATLETRRGGLRVALRFLSTANAGQIASRPELLTAGHVRGYHRWLESQWKSGKLEWQSARHYYSNFKSTFVNLHEYGYVNTDPAELFEGNPFRGERRKIESTPRLSDDEYRNLARALKQDLVETYHGRLSLRPSELIVSRYLIVAMRTGDSTVPLLELSRNPPKEGPIPGTMLLTTQKYRAHRAVERVMRSELGRAGNTSSSSSEQPLVVSPDAAAVLRVTLTETESLVIRAPAQYKDRVWLYEKTRGKGSGEVTALTQSSVQKSAKAIVQRHGLKGDDGKPLRLNPRRLRATFGHISYEVTNGDMVRTSNLLGNTERIVGTNYLSITEQIMARGVGFVNSLPARLRKKIVSSGAREVHVSDTAVTTPVSKCGDPVNGEFSPRDGSSMCDLWVMCLFCSQCAIAGDEEELWRLFSFRGFAQKELDRFVSRHGVGPSGDERSDLLKELYRLAIPFIGEFARANFSDRVVHRAELRAQREPHPFWVYQDELAMLRR